MDGLKGNICSKFYCRTNHSFGFFHTLGTSLVNAGVPQGLEDIARRLALLDADASLVGNVEPLFSSVVFLATVYLLTQTALATIGAFFYNLVSDLVGGIEVVVLEESYNTPQEKISENTQEDNQDSKETMMMTFSKTLKNFKNEEDENE